MELADTPLSVLVADLDLFKSINDKLGHQGADRVLERITEQVRSVLGRRGKGYRWGGEELVGILPEFTEEEAGAVAERLRLAVERTSYSGLIAGEVTVSIGVAQRDADEDVTCLFDRADAASSAAKKMGRNRVYLASGTPWRAGTPQGRVRTRKLVYVLDREEFIRDIAADFIGMEGYATKSFGSAEKMFNSTEQPDLLLVGVGNEYDSPADGLQIARARWPSPLCQRHVRQLPLDISVLTGGEWCHDRAEAIPSS